MFQGGGGGGESVHQAKQIVKPLLNVHFHQVLFWEGLQRTAAEAPSVKDIHILGKIEDPRGDWKTNPEERQICLMMISLIYFALKGQDLLIEAQKYPGRDLGMTLLCG